jgi:hypothetical protein
VVIDGNNTERVFDILPTTHVNLAGLKIQHGNPGPGGEGGGILIRSTAVLTISDSLITVNQASFGGGIMAVGRLNLTDSTVSANQDGIRNNAGLLMLTIGTIEGNTQGAGIYNSGHGSLTFNGGWVTNNQGGVYNNDITTLTTSAVDHSPFARQSGHRCRHKCLMPNERPAKRRSSGRRRWKWQRHLRYRLVRIPGRGAGDCGPGGIANGWRRDG